MVDGVHFRLRDGWMTPAEVGCRALAGALSDLAAMGADAGRGLPRAGPAARASTSSRRSSSCAARRRSRADTGTTIAGGDVVSAPALTVSVTASAGPTRADELVGRDGARRRGSRRRHRQPRRRRRRRWPCSKGARARAPRRGAARARAPPAPAAARGPRAGAGGGARDDRPLRRPGHRRRAHRPRERRAAARASSTALPLQQGVAEVAERAGRPAVARWRPAGGKTTSCASARRAEQRARVRGRAWPAAGGRASPGSAR